MPPHSQQILQRVAQFIAQQQLLRTISDDASTNEVPPFIHVALSGGPDSVALLHILHSLGYRCQALHCNFHLRGDESNRDELFCHNLCQSLDIPLVVREFDTYQHMQDHHLSLEMAARELRYDWWKEYELIALGHHQDDSIETLLMNLMRGTGIQGLTGIVPKNETAHVIRPLLCLKRSEILSYLADNHLQYITDSTNLENDTLRNCVRNQLLPLMEQLLPQARQGIVQTMQHLQGSQHFAQAYMEQLKSLTHHYNCWGIEWDEILFTDIREALPQFSSDYIHYWAQQYSQAECRIRRDNQRLYTAPIDEAIFDVHHPELSISQPSDNEPLSNQADSKTQYFDADTIVMPLTLRRYQKGDRMMPLGLNGHSKLLSDLFQNAHYSPMQKSTTWIVTDATGAIIWVIGLRISHLHRVTEVTRNRICLTVKEKNE